MTVANLKQFADLMSVEKRRVEAEERRAVEIDFLTSEMKKVSLKDIYKERFLFDVWGNSSNHLSRYLHTEINKICPDENKSFKHWVCRRLQIHKKIISILRDYSTGSRAARLTKDEKDDLTMLIKQIVAGLKTSENYNNQELPAPITILDELLKEFFVKKNSQHIAIGSFISALRAFAENHQNILELEEIRNVKLHKENFKKYVGLDLNTLEYKKSRGHKSAESEINHFLEAYFLKVRRW